MAPPLVRSTAAFDHGMNAYGARYLRAGFAFSESDDVAFALGFPHVRWLLDGHPDDADPAASAKAMILEVTPLNERLEIPRQTAIRLARAVGSEQVWQHRWTPEADAVLARSEPIELDEGRELIAGVMRRSSPSFAPQLAAFILEAFHGPEHVAEWIVSAMQSLEEAPRFSDFLIYQLGFLLLRVRPNVYAHLRERVEQVFVRWARASKLELPLPVAPKVAPNFDAALRTLDILLYGAAGASRSLMPIVEGLDIRGVAHVVDDPAYVRKIIAQEAKNSGGARKYFDARLVFLGGLELVDHYATRVSVLKTAGERARIINTFGAIQAPSVVAMMVDLVGTPKSRKPALAWLIAHKTYAIPMVETLAKGEDPGATTATAILAELRA